MHKKTHKLVRFLNSTNQRLIKQTRIHNNIKTRLALVLVLSLIFLGGHIHTALAAPAPKADTSFAASDNELLVKLSPSTRDKVKADATDTGVASINNEFKNRHVKKFDRVTKPGIKSLSNHAIFDWYKVSIDPATVQKTKKDGKTINVGLEDLKTALKKDPNVISVEENYVLKASIVPNDPYYSSVGSWGQTYADMWGLKRINPEAAWDLTTGSKSVIIADIDTGVDIANPELAGNIWVNTGEIPGDGIDNDGNGYIDDTNGWNFSGNNNNVNDDHGHGTITAGIIAAAGNNSTGVVGVNWTSSLMPVKFMDKNGNGYMADAASALVYAANNGARVSSNSYGCSCRSQMLDDAVKYEHDRNMVTVAGAGNGNGSDALDFSPASSDGSVAVGATSNSDQLSYFSNNGPRIDVVAPGENILSIKAANGTLCYGIIVVANNYCYENGTSVATPFVSGLAALMLAHNPALSNEDVRQIIRSTAQDIGPAGRDYNFGYGLINMSDALNQSSSTPPIAYISSPFSRTNLSQSSVDVIGSVGGGGFSSYRLEIGKGRDPSSLTLLSTGTNTIQNGVLGTIVPSSLEDGQYTLRLTVTDLNGKNYVYELYDLTVDNFNQSISLPTDIIPIGHTSIRGTAAAKNISTFASYKLDYGVGASPTSWISTGISSANSTTAVSNSILSTWDTSSLSDSQQYTLRLTVTLTGGVSKSTTVQLTTDKNLVSEWPLKLDTPSCYSSCEGTPAFADLNNDGQKELIVAGPGSNQIYAYYKDGSQVAGFPVSVAVGDWFKWPVSIADVNNDGYPEIIVSAFTPDHNSRLYIINHTGQLLPGWPTPIFSMAGMGMPGMETASDMQPTIADLDGDGVKEIVTLNEYSFWSGTAVMTMHTLHAMHADGTEMTGFPKEIPIQANSAQHPMTIADLDGDGRPEIAVGSYDRFYLFDNQGNLLPGWPYQAPLINGQTALFQSTASVGDIDGNGQLEIFSTAAPAGVTGVRLPLYGWKKSGALVSGFPQQTGLYGSTRSGSPLNNTATADINKDGKDEVVVGFNTLTIHSLGGVLPIQAASGNGSVTISDFTGNGSLKISAGMGSQQNAIQVLNDDGSVFYHMDTALSNNFIDPFVSADMDNDGQLEYASIKNLSSSPGAYVYIWHMPSASTGSWPVSEWPMFGQDSAMTNHFTLGSRASSDIAPPTVTLTSPLNGSTVNGTMNVSAYASDNFGVAKVEFYVDNTLVSTDSTSPYSFSWDSTTVANGTHTLVAKAYDSANLSSTSSATITVNNPDITPPTVAIISPITNSTVNGSVNISAYASDNVAVNKVEFYVDTVLKSVSYTSPYFYDWDSTTVANGSHSIIAKVYDTSSLSSTSFINVTVNNPDVTPPTVVMTAPLAGSTVNGTVNITANATDNVAVVNVEFYVDNIFKGNSTTSPYSFSWDSTTVANGTHTLVAKAYDSANLSSTSSATITVNNPDIIAPSISITSPFNGSLVGGLVNFSANATDNIAVTKVEFYIDGGLKATSTNSPYSYSWDSTTVPNGTHTLMAKAYDAANNTATSSASVSVSNRDVTSPTVAITSPLNNTTVSRGTTITIKATATDNIAVTKVEFYVNNTLKCTDTTVSYSCNYQVSNKTGISYTLMAKAYDAAGNIASSSVTVKTK